ncbi:MAG: hypothetical protein K5656_03420, partial [Lachnospiraceae bacterium]|nr:hypothetical protein [Lachnospiraceae bacterium]
IAGDQEHKKSVHKTTKAKAKKKGLLKVTINNKNKSVRKTFIYISNKKNGKYKKVGVVKNNTLKKYTFKIKKCNKKKIKKGKKYFIKVVDVKDVGNRTYGKFTKAQKVKCKK